MKTTLAKWGAKAVDASAALGALLMVALVCEQVVGRALLSSSLPWSEEIAAYLMVWVALVGAASHIQHGEFMALSLWSGRTQPGLRMAAWGISVAATLAFLIILFIVGLKVSLLAPIATLSPAARFPMWIVYLIFPIAAVLIAEGFLKGQLRRRYSAEDEPC